MKPQDIKTETPGNKRKGKKEGITNYTDGRESQRSMSQIRNKE